MRRTGLRLGIPCYQGRKQAISRNRLPRPKNQREFDSKFGVLQKFPAQRNKELLLLELGILNNRTGNVLAQSGNRLCSEERIGDPAADRKLSPGVDMEARQERFRGSAAGASRLTCGRQRRVVIAIPPAHRPEGRGAVMTEASQDTRMSDRKRGAYANRSPLSAHRPKRSSYKCDRRRTNMERCFRSLLRGSKVSLAPARDARFSSVNGLQGDPNAFAPPLY